MDKTSFPETFARLREVKGMTQEEVASALGVSNKTVSKWENGDTSPDLAAVVKIAELFQVSTDALLGAAGDGETSVEDVIRAELSRLSYSDAALRSFEIVRSIIPPVFGVFRAADGSEDYAVPEKAGMMPRSQVVTGNMYELTVNSDNVNLAVMLLRNKSDFSWLFDEGSLGKTAELFTELSRTDTLKIYAFIHSEACSETFTADYMAKNTGVSVETAESVLDRAADIGLCVKHSAHLGEGDTAIYRSYGDGMILSLITLAYEYMCGGRGYEYNLGGNCKLIGGKK